MERRIKFGGKECGSPHLKEKSGKLYCTTCGAVFDKDTETNEERDARILYLSRLDGAEKKLRMSPPRFDDAEDEFRDFINHYPQNSDGYWGLVRARYGIKYEKDISGKEIPSCYKSNYEDFRSDSDFLKALKLSENEKIQKSYKDMAELIAEECEEWRKECEKERYDIFISFKATEDNGVTPTPDPEELKELYTHLLTLGYKVFFSPMSMINKTGKYYDPYILNALQTAKVMIVYGSKPEYFTATWVQNEWERYLRMVSDGKKKKGSCLVAYKNFSPNELPHDLRKLQAIDAGQKIFYHWLIEKIKDVLENGDLANSIDGVKVNKDLRSSLPYSTLPRGEKGSDNIKSAKTFKEKLNSFKDKIINEIFINPAKKHEGTIVPDSDMKVVDGCLLKYTGKDKHIILPDHITSIFGGAFSQNYRLASITIPDSVTAIDDEAFKHCANLSRVTIGSGVTSIGDGTFEFCEKLTEITIPDNIAEIGYRAFACCDKLSRVNIGSGVKIIGGSAFEQCARLLEIYIPDNVTEIGYGAFKSCDRLKSIIIGNGVTEIGDEAFWNCKKLCEVTIGKSVMRIGNEAFAGCSSLTEVTLPKGVVSIGREAFALCDKLVGVTIPDTIERIGDSAFLGCEALTILAHDLHVVHRLPNLWNPSNRPVWDAKKTTDEIDLNDVILRREDFMS